MAFLLFGKKRKVRRQNKKPPAALLRLCKKCRIKIFKHVGKKKVYRAIGLLKRLCAKKAKRMHKTHKIKCVRKCRRGRRSMGFGYTSGSLMGAPFQSPSNYGYNQPVIQSQQTLSQTNTSSGVNREFFGQQVPTQLPPNWDFMGQPGGQPPVAVGSPFYEYATPISSFGSRRGGRKCAPRRPRYRKYNVPGSPCNLTMEQCKTYPGSVNCQYVKYRGCRRRPKQLSYPWDSMNPSGRDDLNELSGVNLPIRGDEPLGDYASEAGITFFGRRRGGRKCAPRRPRYRKYNVPGSPCNLKMQQCKTYPGSINCQYVKGRGCRRRPKQQPYSWDSMNPSARDDLNELSGVNLPIRGDEPLGDYASEAGITFFGRRRGRPRRCRRAPRKRRINSKSACNRLKKKDCRSTPGCSYVSGRKRYGCKRKPQKLPYSWDTALATPMMPPGFTSGSTSGSIRDPLFDYMPGQPAAFGLRRCKRAPAKRRINSKSPCNKLKKKDCKAKPGCGYVSSRKRYGCKRKPVYAKRS
jgi:hypothetical protein